MRVQGAWPAIVDVETFDKVQRELHERRPLVVHPRTVPSRFLLSGLAFCFCGRALTGGSGKSGQYSYYVCSRAFREGRAACQAKMLPKEKLEDLVIKQLKSRILTQENMEKLAVLVNEELRVSGASLQERLDVVDAEVADLKARLQRLYDALETGKIALEDLAPRIRELRVRQGELQKIRVQTEAEMAAEVGEIDVELVAAYAQDMTRLFHESDLMASKRFIRSFVKRITKMHSRIS